MEDKTFTFDSGAQRQKLDDVRYDLISPIALKRLARVYAHGATRYGENNWRKGFPVSVLLNHILAHLVAYLERAKDEDHLAHAFWGIAALIEQEELRPEFDDRYK